MGLRSDHEGLRRALTLCREPVKAAPRPPLHAGIDFLPEARQPAVVLEAMKQRVDGPALQTGALHQLESVPLAGRVAEQRLNQGQRLPSNPLRHELILHSYVGQGSGESDISRDEPFHGTRITAPITTGYVTLVCCSIDDPAIGRPDPARLPGVSRGR